MSSAELWATLLGMGLLTFALRSAFLLLPDRLRLPGEVQRALRFVPAAVLAAMIAPAVLRIDGELALSTANPRLVALLLAALVAWRSGSVVLTLAVGMGCLWALQALLPVSF